MSTLRIEKGPLPISVIVPTSKSYANRALILSAAKPGPKSLTNLPDATDVTQLVSALKGIGLSISQQDRTLLMANSFPECESLDTEIYVGEGGTTARFLAALVLLGKKRYTLRLGKRLKVRPWDEFLELARSLDCEAKLEDDRLILQGPLKAPSRLSVDCSRTTQFATAFDLILKGTEVIPENLHSSESYWKMNAPLKSHFQTSSSYSVPGDWSSAAFPMVFAALNHEIHFPGLKPDPLQADSKILDVLKTLDAVTIEPSGISVHPVESHRDITLNMSDCLDLFPAICFLLSHVRGHHKLTGLGNLTHKESDRLTEMSKILKAFSKKFKADNDSIQIEGSGDKFTETMNLELPDDHRIVMTAALFLRHHHGGVLSNPESVKKSYPEFFHLLK